MSTPTSSVLAAAPTDTAPIGGIRGLALEKALCEATRSQELSAVSRVLSTTIGAVSVGAAASTEDVGVDIGR